MIVPSMNSEELTKEILQDFETVSRKAQYLAQKIRRIALKSQQKFFRQEFDYKSTKNNEWLIIVACTKKESIFTAIVTYRNTFGFNAIMINSNQKALIHFTGHFFDRFNERYLKLPNPSKRELLKRFIAKNFLISNCSIQNTTKGQYNVLGVVSEGIGLGYKEIQKENEICHYKTFITNDMIHHQQKPIFDELKKYYGMLQTKSFNPIILGNCA